MLGAKGVEPSSIWKTWIMEGHGIAGNHAGKLGPRGRAHYEKSH